MGNEIIFNHEMKLDDTDNELSGVAFKRLGLIEQTKRL